MSLKHFLKIALNKLLCWLAIGFGSGLLPKAPGTWGTLAAVPISTLLFKLTFIEYAAFILIGFFLGSYACHIAGASLGKTDHSHIVWDEMIGYWITLFLIPPTWTNLTLGFVLFRLFDILKPFPICYFDQNIKNGFGVMLDDVLAGIFANLLLQIYLMF